MREALDEHRPGRGSVIITVTALYFLATLVEVLSEYFKDETWVMASKPLLMPLLAGIYWLLSKRRNLWILLALVLSWGANMLFISKSFEWIIVGTIVFTAYRVVMLAIVVRYVRIPSTVPLLIGCVPFLFIYLFVSSLTADELREGFWLFVFQGIFAIAFGGIALGSYIFKPNKSNTYLLISTMLFTFTQFIFVIRLFYLSLNVFQPMAMTLYAAGQYLLILFFVNEERKSTAKKVARNS